MRTLRDHVFWALATARLWRLNDGEARMLAAIAAHADDSGECVAGNPRLAVFTDRHPDTARKLIASLARKGLVTNQPRGGGRTALRRLCTEKLPFEQLELKLNGLEEAESSTEVPGYRDPGSRHPGCSTIPDAAAAGVPGDSFAPLSSFEGLTEGKDARDSVPGGVAGLVSTLPKVIEVLGTAPGLTVEELSVNAILQGHPETDGYDHEQAAWTVTSWAHEGGLAMTSAPRLLQRALAKQQRATAPHVTAAAVSGARRGGREPVAAGQDFSRFKRSAGW